MALIKCPECQREVSRWTKACPHCGYPDPWREKPEQREARLYLHGYGDISRLLIVVGFALYGGIYFYASEPSVYGGLFRFGGLSVGARVLEVLGFVAGVFGLWLGLGYWMARAGPR